MTFDPIQIRHRADGSIDTSFYMERGRAARSDAAWSLFRRRSAGARSAAPTDRR